MSFDIDNFQPKELFSIKDFSTIKCIIIKYIDIDNNLKKHKIKSYNKIVTFKNIKTILIVRIKYKNNKKKNITDLFIEKITATKESNRVAEAARVAEQQAMRVAEQQAMRVAEQQAMRVAEQQAMRKAKAKKILMLRAESFGLDPRRDTWYESNFPQNIKLHQQCILGNGTRLVNNTIHNNIINIIDGNNYSFEDLKIFSDNETYIEVLHILEKFIQIKLNDNCINFEWYKIFLLSTTYKHIKNYKNGYKVIMAINFPTLIAAILLKSIYNVKVIYECLEWFPYHNNIFTEEENTYWMNFEKELVKYADYCNVVSPGLANKMSNTYNKHFDYIPNCVPLSISKNIIKTDTSTDNKCRFLFQGCLSQERNLEILINLWDKVNENAILIIRGPNCSYLDELKQLVTNKNLSNNTILFPKEIPSNKLLEGIVDDCDVGVLPYGPLNMNYKYCSPNKMGEFIAMGKPILANKTEYVSQVVTEADCGIVVDFTNENLLIDSINKLTIDTQLRKKYSENSFKYHQKEFNWENKSQDFYNKIYEFVKDK